MPGITKYPIHSTISSSLAVGPSVVAVAHVMQLTFVSEPEPEEGEVSLSLWELLVDPEPLVSGTMEVSDVG